MKRGMFSFIRRIKPKPLPITMDFTLPSGYTVTFDDSGISSVTNQGKQIAYGGVSLLYGQWFYQAFQAGGFTLNISSKSFSSAGNSATVTHNYTGLLDARVVYTFTVNGNQIDCSAQITNNTSTPITIPTFRSPFFRFDDFNAAKASSNQLNFDQGHTQSNATNGITLNFPTSNVKMQATYVITTAGTGAPCNFCTWNGNSPDDQFMTMGVGIFGNTGQTLSNFFFNPVPANGSAVYKWSYLFSNSTDWQVLLAPHKNFVRSKLSVQYDPDARPWVQFVSISSSNIRPDNPYGYNDNGDGVFRRFDTAVGCQDYITKLVPPMQDVNYQGIILWQPQGINPRGVQYRPDFNVWPPVSIPNIPTLFGGFTSAGKRVGLLSRPGVTITSSTWDTDSLTKATDHTDSIADIKGRTTWATGQGVTAFYLDSFANDRVDHSVLKILRTQVGPSFQIFTEQSTSLTVPYAGLYAQFTYSGGVYTFYKNFDQLRFLYPEANVFAKLTSALPPGGYSELYTYMFQNKLSPVVEDYRTLVPTENQILKPLVSQYIDGSNHWR